MLGALQKYIPAADAVLALLGTPQRQFLNANIGDIPAYLQTEDGKASLLLLLENFAEYSINKNFPKA